jgi:hypothetical protein
MVDIKFTLHIYLNALVHAFLFVKELCCPAPVLFSIFDNIEGKIDICLRII